MSENLTDTNNGCLDWNGTLESDGKVFTPLEGDYNFKVVDFDRGRFPGGGHTPACYKAMLILEVEVEDTIVKMHTDFILHKNFEWLLSAFFRSIGQKKRGERLVMNWDKVVGSMGRARFKPKTYIDKNGNERQVNTVDLFYDYDPAFFPEGDFLEVTDDATPPFN